MKATIDDYKSEICSIINKIDNMERLIHIWSYVNRVFQIHQEEDKKED